MRKCVALLTGCVVLLLVLAALPTAAAQPGTWAAYPSHRTVNAVDSDATSLWVATSGGVFRYRTDTGEVTRYSTVNGLYSVGAQTIEIDSVRQAVWVGYGEGVMDRIDIASGAVTSYFDIARATQYTDRRINRIRQVGDSLYVATAFGLVVFDAEQEVVRDTYARLGPLDPATVVSDALVAPLPDGEPGLWVGTAEGVVHAPLASPNLQQPSAWTLDPQAPDDVNVLILFRGRVVAGAEDAYERKPDGTWGRVFFTTNGVTDLAADDDRLFGTATFRLFVTEPGVGGSLYTLADFSNFQSLTLTPEGEVWVGDRQNGLFTLPLPSQTGQHVAEASQRVVPEGPLFNAIVDIGMGPDGTLWTAHDNPFGFSGASRLGTEGWTVYSGADTAIDVPNRTLASASVGPDGSFYAASLGDGLLHIQPDGTVVTYRTNNSSLQPTTGSTDFVVVGDAAVDDDGYLWVTNKGAMSPLHVRAPDGTWTALPYPPGIPTTVQTDRLQIDAFGQKWITGRQSTSTGGRGLLAYSTGSTPTDPSDDQGLALSGSPAVGLGLPDETVNALAIDLDDRLWIGTERGLATIFATGSAFGGDPSLVQPQWARTADGTSFLLRDLVINDIAIDPAGQIWLASEAGAWLLNAEGDTVLENFTRENSPLFSNTVVSVAVDPNTGRVFFATDLGLLSYEGEATAPVASVQDLDIAPSPYRPGTHAGGVLISGLVERTTVRILTLDGQVVATLDGRGGTLRWDGRDQRTGALVGSGVYLVAAVAEDGDATAYGKIAVVR